MHRMGRFALLALGQGGDHLCQRLLRCFGNFAVAGILRLGKADQQRLDFNPCKALWRQGRVFLQHIAIARLPIDPRARRAQGSNVAVDRPLGHLGFLRQPRRRHGAGQGAHQVQQAEETISAGHKRDTRQTLLTETVRRGAP